MASLKPMSHERAKTSCDGISGIIGSGGGRDLRRKGFQFMFWNGVFSSRSVRILSAPGEVVRLQLYPDIWFDDDADTNSPTLCERKSYARHSCPCALNSSTPDSMRAAAEIVERSKARLVVEAPFTGSKTAAEKGVSSFTCVRQRMRHCAKRARYRSQQ